MNIDCGHTLHMNVAFNVITIKRNKSASKTAGVECLNKKVNTIFRFFKLRFFTPFNFVFYRQDYFMSLV